MLECQAKVEDKFQYLRSHRISSRRIRVHGSLELRQALYTGKDFVLIDLEGEPDRPLGERRIKRAPLRDLAGMVQSFYYASHAVLFGKLPGVIADQIHLPALEHWADLWYCWASAEFVNGYLDVPAVAALLPRTVEEMGILLEIYMLERAVRESALEITHRPDWVQIPVRSVLSMIGSLK